MTVCAHGHPFSDGGYSSCVLCPPHPPHCRCQAPCPLQGRTGVPELGEIVDIKAKLPWGDLLSIPAKVTRIVDGVAFAVSVPIHPGGPIYFIGEQPLLRGLAWSRRAKP